MKCPYGPDASCAECEDTSQVCHPEHGLAEQNVEERIKKLEETIEILASRITDLEEKERQRDRDAFDTEIHLDEVTLKQVSQAGTFYDDRIDEV